MQNVRFRRKEEVILLRARRGGIVLAGAEAAGSGEVQEQGETRKRNQNTDNGGRLHGEAETDGSVTDVGRAYRGHEHGGKTRDPVQTAVSGKPYGKGPESHAGHGLVCPAEVPPDDGEVEQRERHSAAEKRNGSQNASGNACLIDMEAIGQHGARGTEGSITGADGQKHHAENGEKSADGAKQRYGYLLNNQGRRSLRSHGSGETRRIGIEGERESGPDESQQTFGDHGAVKDLASLFFIEHAAGAQRGLRGMETGNRTAGNGNEKNGPHGSVV